MTETEHDISVTIFDIFIFKKYGTNSKFYRTVPPLPMTQSASVDRVDAILTFDFVIFQEP